MNPDLLLALVGFAVVSSITPGPNNMMLLASGVNFGMRRTIPHMMGVCLGFTLMLVIVGLLLVTGAWGEFTIWLRVTMPGFETVI